MRRAVRHGPGITTLGSLAPSKLNLGLGLCRADARQVLSNTLVSAFIAAPCHWKRYTLSRLPPADKSLPFSIDFLSLPGSTLENLLRLSFRKRCSSPFPFYSQSGELQLCCSGMSRRMSRVRSYKNVFVVCGEDDRWLRCFFTSREVLVSSFPGVVCCDRSIRFFSPVIPRRHGRLVRIRRKFCRIGVLTIGRLLHRAAIKVE